MQCDQADELTSRTASLGSNTLAESQYTYNPAGQRTSRTGLTGTSTFTYDAAGRLTGAAYPTASGLTDATYTYDPAGNRTSADGVPYAYDAADRLTSDGAYTYAYDDSGNVISRTDVATGAVASFDWNADHQLLAVHYPDGTATTYSYDALGRRIGVDAAGQTTGYVYDGSNIHLEYDGSANLTAVYTTGLRSDSPLEMTRDGQNYYYLQDGLGSTTALTNAAGSVVDSYRYDAFGNPVSTGTVENPFTFTGREYDSTDGIYYYRARYYDPSAGRFLSEDPIFALNPYPYAGNDPIDYVDPTGADDIEEYAILSKQELGGIETAAGQNATAQAENAITQAVEGVGKVGQDGEFSIINWDNYPENIPQPQGPFRLINGEEYDAARAAANQTNRAIHAADPSLEGMQIHEIQPVKFAGSPTDITNKIPLTPLEHARVTTWWRVLQRMLED